MTERDRKLHLGFTIWPTGFHPAGWRLPQAAVDGYSNPDLLAELARTAERGLFDFYFIGDQLIGLPEWQHDRPNQVLRPEALSFAGFIAAKTERIGIVVTVNTTYADPFTVARATATLDQMSKGRIGWNVVTGEAPQSAQNYGRKEHWDNDRRYEWAGEFVDVVAKLWDSWEDGARVSDKTGGVFVDESRVHRISHKGEFFQVEGPLNVERPPQGRLPIVNAGRSDASVELGARFSDIKFVNSSTFGLKGAKAYYADLKARAARYGRDPEDQYVISGIVVYTGETDEQAHALFRQVHELATKDTDLAELGRLLGTEVAGLDEGALVADALDEAALPEQGRLVVAEAREQYGTDEITVRDLYLSAYRRFHFREIVGGPQRIADILESWWRERAVDGWMIFPPYVPGALDDFVRLVIPELQRRGIYRTEYTGSTLREHFGLPRPASRYAAPDTRSRHLVSAGELRAAIDAADPDLVVLDVRFIPGREDGRDEYARAHIPGARYVDLPTELAGEPSAEQGRRPLPDPVVLQENLRRWGISDSSKVVLYDDRANLSSSRGWWLLRWAGLRNVRVLDGALAAWRAAGGPTTSDTPTPVPGDVTVRPGSLPVVALDEVQDGAGIGLLVDARESDQYLGASAGLGGEPGGHIPGARSLPGTTLTGEDGTFCSPEEIRALAAQAGLTVADDPAEQPSSARTVAYCGGGIVATHLLLGLASAGIEGTLFPGSWSQWAADPTRPIAVGPTPDGDVRTPSAAS